MIARANENEPRIEYPPRYYWTTAASVVACLLVWVNFGILWYRHAHSQLPAGQYLCRHSPCADQFRFEPIDMAQGVHFHPGDVWLKVEPSGVWWMVRVEHEYLQQGGENYPPGYFTDSQDNSE